MPWRLKRFLLLTWVEMADGASPSAWSAVFRRSRDELKKITKRQAKQPDPGDPRHGEHPQAGSAVSGRSGNDLKKIPKSKPNNLDLGDPGTGGHLRWVGFGIVKFQFSKLASLREKRAKAEQKLQEMRNAVKGADKVEAE